MSKYCQTDVDTALRQLVLTSNHCAVCNKGQRRVPAKFPAVNQKAFTLGREA